MLKKLIILLGIFAIENSINCAAAANVIGINYITQVTEADLAQIQPKDMCAICRDLLSDTSNLYKSNCRQWDAIHPHIFHRDCILEWITSKQLLELNCPICRGQMVDHNAQNNTALINAIRNGRLEDVRLLLGRGADVNARNNDRITALMFASMYGHLEIVQLLLDRGADINARNIYGITALIEAIVHGHLKIIRLLLNSGADINLRINNEYTALMIAVKTRHLEIVQLLLDRGADINARNNDGITALMIARQNGNQRIADLLIEDESVWHKVAECTIL